MTRNSILLVGLTSMLLVTGCRQVPLREGVHPAGTHAAPVKNEKLESQLSLGRLSERHGQNDYAVQVYRSILTRHPDHPVAHHRLAVLLAQANEADEADRHFELALKNSSRSPQLLADIGYFFYLQDRLDDAESMLRESLDAQANNKAARNNLALVLGEQQRYDEALAEFKKCLPEAEAHANMGYVYSMCGNLDQAEVEYNTALSMDSTLRNAAEALLQLSERRKAERSIARAHDAKTRDEAMIAQKAMSAEKARAMVQNAEPAAESPSDASAEKDSPTVQPVSHAEPTVKPVSHTEPTDQETGSLARKQQPLIASMYDRAPTIANDRPLPRPSKATSPSKSAGNSKAQVSSPAPATPIEPPAKAPTETADASARQVPSSQTTGNSTPAPSDGSPARYSLSDTDSTDPIASGPFELTPTTVQRNISGTPAQPWQQTTWSTQK